MRLFMSDETGGLIERAAALMRQPRSPRPESNSADDPLRSDSQGGTRSNHPENHIGHSGQPVGFHQNIQPMPAPVVVEEEEWRLKHLFRIVLLHKFTLTATTLLCFAASAAAILSLTQRYTATAVVAVGERAPSVATRIETDVDGNVVQLSPDEAAVNTQVEYLRSRLVAERAMDYLHLWSRPEFDPSARPRGGPVNTVKEWIRPAI